MSPNKALVVVLNLLTSCVAHSWVERVAKIELNGTLVGPPGYTRGAVPRTPTFIDQDMQYLLPPHGRYPGDFIAFQYQENGHVTLPSNTPQKKSSGQVYIYGTQSPSDEDTLLSIHRVWNMEGTGGDRRGKLLAKWPFDDGRCYQKNDKEISLRRQQLYSKDDAPPQYGDLWCQADARIPLDVRGEYTIYWVWDWPSLPTDQFPSGQEEIYSSCIDVDVLDSPALGDMVYEEGQDLNSAAVEDQVMSEQFLR